MSQGDMIVTLRRELAAKDLTITNLQELVSTKVSLVTPGRAESYAGNDRSPEWPKVRADHLAVWTHCAACGARAYLEVHHIKPFHRFPSLELNPLNLITLCDHPYRRCHFVLGHLCDWRAYNPDVREDAARLLTKIRSGGGFET